MNTDPKHSLFYAEQVFILRSSKRLVMYLSGAKIKFLLHLRIRKNWLFPQNFILILILILIFILHVKNPLLYEMDDTGLIMIRSGLYFDCHLEFKFFSDEKQNKFYNAKQWPNLCLRDAS